MPRYDSYPGGFNCFAPYYWADGELATYLWGQHVEQSPTTPHMIPEFQGGSIDSWGGAGYDNCASLVGAEFERYLKALISMVIHITDAV